MVRADTIIFGKLNALIYFEVGYSFSSFRVHAVSGLSYLKSHPLIKLIGATGGDKSYTLQIFQRYTSLLLHGNLIMVIFPYIALTAEIFRNIQYCLKNADTIVCYCQSAKIKIENSVGVNIWMTFKIKCV